MFRGVLEQDMFIMVKLHRKTLPALFTDKFFLFMMHHDVLLQVFLNPERLLTKLALKLLLTMNLEVRLELLTGADRLAADMTNVRIFLGLRVFPGQVGLQALSSFTLELTLVAVHGVMTLLVQLQVVLRLDRLVAAGYVAHPHSVLFAEGSNLIGPLRYCALIGETLLCHNNPPHDVQNAWGIFCL